MIRVHWGDFENDTPKHEIRVFFVRAIHQNDFVI